MLRARWRGFEIDSSEAAYEVEVPQPERMGTLVRKFLTSGYFARSYQLVFEEPIFRLRDYIKKYGDLEDRLTAKTLEYLEGQIAKINPKKYSNIGVRAIETILNYVGAHREELLQAGVFRFGLTKEQEELYKDMDFEFEPGQMVDESIFYSETEIPLDGVVLFLSCKLTKLDKLPPEDAKKTYGIVKEYFEEIGLLEELEGWDFLVKEHFKEIGFLEELEGWDFLFGRQRDYVKEVLNSPLYLSLRVRLNPDATFTISGRWFDDGQFLYPHYEFILEQAAKKAQAKIEFHMIY